MVQYMAANENNKAEREKPAEKRHNKQERRSKTDMK
jgi:hypothetical protein